jgi:hypothetical protein
MPAHIAPPGETYPFTCPACKEEVTKAAEPLETKAAGLKYRNAHKGQNKGCAPIFLMAPVLIIVCALHVLLAVAGTVFSNGIAKHLTSQVQCDIIDEYLHTKCGTAYKCKRVKLSESHAAMKRPSLNGRAANEVIRRMKDFVMFKNLGGEPTREDQHVINTADAFITMYNVAMDRMKDCSDKV